MNEQSEHAEGGLEEALSRLEGAADQLIQVVNATARAAKRAKAIAADGSMREMQSVLETTVQLAGEAAESARSLRDGWSFDVEGWFAAGEYKKELLAAAAAGGVSAFESDERILCYPAIVQVPTSDPSVVIDKRRERRVRPSVVVAKLRALQSREPRFKAEAFIESLAFAYDLVVASKKMRPGAAVKLVDVHRVLTAMPGAAREYTLPEFARDIYLIDQSGVVLTKGGRQMSLPASALTRSSGVLRTVTRTGQSKDYAGISFDGGEE
ncbi:MAG TPA: hypothetical protein VMD59_17960 [Acidimicrobiales bacterium]|nr:hypothetical protein [Acidimicrobiales bacterium]